ncbi:adenosylcobinamide amidohydrolase [Paenibacillus ferrarius]|uniref:adenosylcobinamide amidohydrolase n=1 Tax=Paenibacillus ferrarius TaxID=1469647 RepID=UPI003D2B067F
MRNERSAGASAAPGGVRAELVRSPHGEYLRVDADNPLRTLNSSPWGGGFGWHRHLVNRQVSKFYNEPNPLLEMETFLEREGLEPEATAGMLTAAYVADVGHHAMTWPEEGTAAAGAAVLRVEAWVTVGLGNKARAGAVQDASRLYLETIGTINTIVVVEGALTDAAMVNAVITATEAKAAALQALGVTVDGEAATGTTTDAVLIAATGQGPTYHYAGTATTLGYFIGRTVYEAILASGMKYSEVVQQL